MIEMKLQSIYFDRIKNGEKVYEIRLNDEKRRLLKVNDKILFSNLDNANEKLEVTVENLLHFNSFDEVLEHLPLDKLGFKEYKKEEVKNIYYQIYNSTDEKKYGVVAILLSNIKLL